MRISDWSSDVCSSDLLAQEVFLRLLRYSEKTAVENPLGYLLRIAGNVASEWRERARVSKPHDQEWLDDLLIEPDKEPDRKSVVQGKSVSVRVDLGGRRIIKKKIKTEKK